MMRRNYGFTLVELLAVVAIISLLLAIALPAYSQYRVIALRGAAKAVLMELVAREDVYLGQQGTYVADVADSGVIMGFNIPGEVNESYKVTVNTVASVSADYSMPGYTITATPRSGSSQEADGSLTVNQFGLRTPVEKW